MFVKTINHIIIWKFYQICLKKTSVANYEEAASNNRMILKLLKYSRDLLQKRANLLQTFLRIFN